MPFNSTLDVGWYDAGFQSLDEDAKAGDTKESYLLCNNAVFEPSFIMDANDPLAGSELLLPPANLLPDYERVLRAYTLAMTNLNHELNSLLFRSVGLNDTDRLRLASQPFTPVKQLKYAPASELAGVDLDENALGAGEHAGASAGERTRNLCILPSLLTSRV